MAGNYVEEFYKDLRKTIKGEINMAGNYVEEFYKDLRKTIKEVTDDALKFFKENKKAAMVIIGVYLFWKWFIKDEEECDDEE